MKLKEIKPGMEIHCKNDEEKKALLEEAERLGYVWYNIKTKPTKTICSYNTIHFYDAGTTDFSADYKHITCSENIDSSVIEFSDLVLPELRADEALLAYDQMCRENYCCNDCPIYEILGHECTHAMDGHISEILDAIKKWKADHEKEEPEMETEWFWEGRIFEVLAEGGYYQIKGDQGLYDTGCKYLVSAEEYMADKLKEYCRTHDGEFIATVQHICRVKAVE